VPADHATRREGTRIVGTGSDTVTRGRNVFLVSLTVAGLLALVVLVAGSGQPGPRVSAASVSHAATSHGQAPETERAPPATTPTTAPTTDAPTTTPTTSDPVPAAPSEPTITPTTVTSPVTTAPMELLPRANTGSGATPAPQSSVGAIDTVSPGAPSDSAALAQEVAPGLVDIDAVLAGGTVEEGTGMVLTASGEVLTNDHVVAGASEITTIDVGNGHTYEAAVAGTDPRADIAVLKLTGASGLETIGIGDSSALVVGEAVVAVGNAKGLGGAPSYAGGAIRAFNQSITVTDPIVGTTEHLTGMIASDSEIVAGDSGGPLVDADGEVVAMDTAIARNGAASFAIPIDEVLDVAEQIGIG
jgi:S1-C subfamily serine protease